MSSYPDPASASAALAARAADVMPGGNTRHTLYHPPYPVYAKRAERYWIEDVDGNRYIDCVNNMSALLHGHGHPGIVAAVTEQARRLFSVAMPTEIEIRLAELICERVPSVERIRFANSGSEAVMMACRTARAATGRAKIAKVEGAYHGAYDAVSLSVRSGPPAWGSPSAPVAVADSEGVPPGVVADTVILPANDVEAAGRILEAHRADLAAVIVDPVIPRLGFLQLAPDYLETIRAVTARHGILLVFDEVFSFRLGYGGMQSVLGIRPDLTSFGKVIGGGLPVGAFGGSAALMDMFDPTQRKPRVDHGGTFNANPMTAAAGAAALTLWTPAEVTRLNELGERLRTGLADAVRTTGATAVVQGYGSLSALLFTAGPIRNHRDLVLGLSQSNGVARMAALHRRLLGAGVQITTTGQFILSTAMDEAVVDQVVEAVAGGLGG